ncbi:MAG: A/G-specific adenine glycosylase [Bdellovibrionales bacterium]|nr:A/G-specific adenine glycosylase [Bdellovibrionales bacterium]
MSVSDAKLKLVEWYRQNKRALPWRENRDPYRIWISETMLQQTTTTAVIPFFERFVGRFPDLNTLAQAPVNAVVEAWAGLGYYSRARNLHKSAQALYAKGGFPKTFEELITFPGFGPYTSRSVASLAFDQAVGVVDGNVIRVLSRFEGQAWEWWKSKARDEVQTHADQWVRGLSSYEMNQALMELGRTICTPKSPSCLLCPIREQCVAWREDRVANLPLPKPRRTRELWLWNPSVEIKKGRILIQKNTHAPFLRGQWLLPGTAERLKSKPKSYHYKHSITHHDIFVTVKNSLPKMSEAVTKWVQLKEIRQHVPASLVQKALAQALATPALDGAADADGGVLVQRKTTAPSTGSRRRGHCGKRNSPR